MTKSKTNKKVSSTAATFCTDEFGIGGEAQTKAVSPMERYSRLASIEGLESKPHSRGSKSPFLIQQNQLFVPKVKTKVFDMASVENRMRNSADRKVGKKQHLSFYTQMATSFRDKGNFSNVDFQFQNKKLSSSLELNNDQQILATSDFAARAPAESPNYMNVVENAHVPRTEVSNEAKHLRIDAKENEEKEQESRTAVSGIGSTNSEVYRPSTHQGSQS